jgi:hypothetical protein
MGEISGKTGRIVAVYEPIKGKEHVEGFFYVGFIMEAEPDPSVLPDGAEYVRLAGNYACAAGAISQMSDIYAFVNKWITDNGYRQVWPDALFVERYDLPIPEDDITGDEPVLVMLPIEA